MPLGGRRATSSTRLIQLSTSSAATTAVRLTLHRLKRSLSEHPHGQPTLGLPLTSHHASGHMEVWAGKEGVAGFRNGPRGAALFRAPRGLCPDANGTLIVADSNNSCIRRVDKDGLRL